MPAVPPVPAVFLTASVFATPIHLSVTGVGLALGSVLMRVMRGNLCGRGCFVVVVGMHFFTHSCPLNGEDAGSNPAVALHIFVVG